MLMSIKTRCELKIATYDQSLAWFSHLGILTLYSRISLFPVYKARQSQENNHLHYKINRQISHQSNECGFFLKPWVEMQISCDFSVFTDGPDTHSSKQQLFFLSWIWESQEWKLQRENYQLTCRWCWACCAHSHWCCKRSVCPAGPADVLRNCYQTCWSLLRSQMSGGSCRRALLKATKTEAQWHHVFGDSHLT